MFRDMRRYRQQLSAEQCREILAAAPRGVLAVNGDGGYPYTVPLDFVQDEGKLYFHCAAEGHKLDAVRRDGRVSFCVLDKGERPQGEWAYYFNSVVVFGRIAVVTDEALRLDKLRKLGLKYYPDAATVEQEIKKNAARAVVLELTVEHMTGKRVHEN